MEYGYSRLCAIVFLSSQIQTIQINITLSSTANHAKLPTGVMWPEATGFHLLLSELYTTDFHSANSLEGQRREI